MLALSGLIGIVVGLILMIRPNIGAVAIVQVFGLFSIVSGSPRLRPRRTWEP